MAVFELNKLGSLGDVVRDAGGGRRVALYAAGLVAGIGIGIAAAVASSTPASNINSGAASLALPSAIHSTADDVVGINEIASLGRVVVKPAITVPVAFGPTEYEMTREVPEVPSMSVAPIVGAEPIVEPELVVQVQPAVPQAQPKPANTQAQPAPQPAQPAPAPAPGLPANFYLPAAPAGDGSMARSVFDGLNAERVAAGLPALKWDDGLSKIARIRSQQMIDQGYFGHRDPHGYSMYYELLKHHGYGYAWAGENLHRNNYAYGEQAGAAVRGFMNSQTHRDNVLYTGFSRVGISAVHDGGMVFITVIFLG